ncbi:MAG: hypothetical protein K8T25_09505 [Planctomycetia bacterium]|nr:hypothetical protein [Planctomycetia bacterium]
MAWSPAMADEPLLLQATPPVASDASTETAKPAPVESEDASTPDAKSVKKTAEKSTEKTTETDATTTTDAGKPTVETIKERFPNGKVKIEREVIRDKDDNYVNHGAWKMWDEAGNVVAEGHFEFGHRQGAWTGWFMPNEVEMLTQMPYKQFQGPFISQAEFADGKLNGQWVVSDAKHNKVSEWGYAGGHRHGTWTTWYANGRKMREVHYNNGDLDGEVAEWSPEGVQVTKEVYQGGRKLARKVEFHSERQKKSEGMFLFAKLELQQDDDWWNAKLAKFVTVGKDERHGDWMAWHPNGQVQMQGKYEHDLPVGPFTWWFANGQKSVVGGFVNGQRNAEWTWYHQNGQKASHGEFTLGGPSGLWVWWSDAGKVAQKVNYSAGTGEVTKTPPGKVQSTNGKSADTVVDPSATDLTPPLSGVESDLVPESSAKAPSSRLQR